MGIRTVNLTFRQSWNWIHLLNLSEGKSKYQICLSSISNQRSTLLWKKFYSFQWVINDNNNKKYGLFGFFSIDILKGKGKIPLSSCTSMSVLLIFSIFVFLKRMSHVELHSSKDYEYKSPKIGKKKKEREQFLIARLLFYLFWGFGLAFIFFF